MQSALNQAAHKTIVDAVADGDTFGEAAALAGVHRVTLSNWLSRGADEEEGPYAELYSAVALAMRKRRKMLEGQLVLIGHDKDAGNPGAITFILERRYKSIYGSEAANDVLPERSKRDLPKDKARDLAKNGRLRSVGGGKK
jgi:hypothetical protein